ncbi:cupin domain-containing protein [Roseospira goensis]|uniref:Quercetin dioxygenase-like cupin family protein n=1 Tax=Roseospira goensis TaxID=391922 RepID=A0A7W6WKA1_9PROT|nr:cupin domain-containing protein [Roseospira goensis]MBB4285900.1 quercetin dioxygenase-like cupin family protein [Roseospira goensis]
MPDTPPPTPPAAGSSPPFIVHLDTLPTYAPPGHSGTVNRRLIDPGLTDTVDMVLGLIEPGGSAAPHRHDTEFQAIVILNGRATVRLGEAPAQDCGPGHVVRIPPGVAHEVISVGPEPLKLIVVYSPPLSADRDQSKTRRGSD